MTRELKRRDFLFGAAATAVASMPHGAVPSPGTPPGSVIGLTVAPMEKIRVGIVGLGARGLAGANRLLQIPGVEITAAADIEVSQFGSLKAAFAKFGTEYRVKEYRTAEGYKALSDDGNVDVVYICGPWQLHDAMTIAGLKGGKHTLVECPGLFTLDGCWEAVELAEKNRINCMPLENCCYGEIEMLMLNLVREGMFGELVHAEGAYIHDLRQSQIGRRWPNVWNFWRQKWNRLHKGNHYAAHGLGPISRALGINRGDRYSYLVSLESGSFNIDAFARAKNRKWRKRDNKPSEWQCQIPMAMGDMNVTLIKTEKGRSIMLQHDIVSPRPYSRLNVLTGTRGILMDYPLRCGFERQPGEGVHSFWEPNAQKIRKEYMHPVWKQIREAAGKVGGHGGMDYIMDLRWAYCLFNGLPLDMDVYDLAAWSQIAPLSERSVRAGSTPQQAVDFTRGAWKAAAPSVDDGFDMEKLRLPEKLVSV